MSLLQSKIEDICTKAAQQLKDLYPELTPAFVYHTDGGLADTILTKDYSIPRHPAQKNARVILEKNTQRNETGFLGLAIDLKTSWMGLIKKHRIMPVFTVNTNQFQNETDFCLNLYHHFWHVIDLMEARKNPELAKRFDQGILIPRRSPMNFSKLTLQADSFSLILDYLQTERLSLQELAKTRALEAITPTSRRKTEDYPFPIALETMEYVFQDLLPKAQGISKNPMETARFVTLDIGKTYEDSAIEQWWSFVEPAQKMAWQNISPDIILGCATTTTDDPFIRGLAFLVSDIAGITPNVSPENTILDAFSTKQTRHELHRKLMEKVFEEAVSKGLDASSGEPFVMAANMQNEGLTEGAFLGWCAHALQSSSRAFEQALKTGTSPSQAARMQFEGDKNVAKIEDLEKISEGVIAQKRQGYAVTLSNIAEICKQNKIFAPILDSIQDTIKDPSHQQKLDAAHIYQPAPAALEAKPAMAPEAPAPSSPVPVTPVSAPSFGFGGNTARVRNQPQQQTIQTKTPQEEFEQKTVNGTKEE